MKNIHNLAPLSRADLKAIQGGGKAYRYPDKCNTSQPCRMGAYECQEASNNALCQCARYTPTSTIGRCAFA